VQEVQGETQSTFMSNALTCTWRTRQAGLKEIPMAVFFAKQ